MGGCVGVWVCMSVGVYVVSGGTIWIESDILAPISHTPHWHQAINLSFVHLIVGEYLPWGPNQVRGVHREAAGGASIYR